jgi:hypothetical protein
MSSSAELVARGSPYSHTRGSERSPSPYEAGFSKMSPELSLCGTGSNTSSGAASFWRPLPLSPPLSGPLAASFWRPLPLAWFVTSSGTRQPSAAFDPACFVTSSGNRQSAPAFDPAPAASAPKGASCNRQSSEKLPHSVLPLFA